MIITQPRLLLTFVITLLVKEVNTSLENSRDPPFYAGTTLNLTCKQLDLPNTVDPQLIRSIGIQKNNRTLSKYNNHSFIPLGMGNTGTYRCYVCLARRDDNRYSTDCHGGREEFEISGKQLL